MLVLTRRLEESVRIGVNIEIKVLEIRRNSVRLGIVAPSDVSVHRSEVYDAIQKENVLASQSEADKLEHLKKILKKKASDSK